MIPNKVYIPTHTKVFKQNPPWGSWNTIRRNDTDAIYISLDAIKEFIYGNYGADDFMEKFNEFIQ